MSQVNEARIKEIIAECGMELKPRQLLYSDEPNGYLVGDADHALDNSEAVRAFFDGGLMVFAQAIIKETLK